MSRFRIIHADVLDALRAMDDNSADAVLTDVPYGLGSHQPTNAELLAYIGGAELDTGGDFMGRDWHVPSVNVWREIFRVLKPGGHLASFAGSRTGDLVSLGIRAAGFEVRDTLQWLYGSGFPKSLDPAKAIDKQRHDRDEVLKVTSWIREMRDAAGITNTQIDDAFGFNGMAGHWTSSASQPLVPTLEQVPTLLDVLGVEVVPEEMRQLIIDMNGVKGSPGEAWFRREKIGEREGLDTKRSRPVPSLGAQSHRHVFDITAPATEEAQQWDGHGTALKPGYEPVILARKPLEGTVAQNIAKWGVGTLAIDACRIGQDVVGRGGGAAGGNTWSEDNCGLEKEGDARPVSGRWPANVVLGHTDECRCAGLRESADVSIKTRSTGKVVSENVAMGGPNYGREVVATTPRPDEEVWVCAEGCPVRMLDMQSGDCPSGIAVQRNGGGGKIFNGSNAGWGPRPDAGYTDSGGASRFFYVAKASRAERDLGCEDLPVHSAAAMTEREEGSAGLQNPRRGSAPRGGARNNHPTVKPVALDKWLATLLLPPPRAELAPAASKAATAPRRILVPYAGSGTEMVGALLAGWDEVIGIEREPRTFDSPSDFVSIAHARCSLAETNPRAFDPESRRTAPKVDERQTSLFGGVK